MSSVTTVTQTGSVYSIAPTVVALPEAVDGDLARFEGMLVSLTGPFTVAQNYFHGRFGQLTLAVGGRMETSTNRFRPGAQAIALADLNARSRIIPDDGSSLQNPNPTPYLDGNALPRAGDTVASLTGVIDYGLATSSNTGFGDYKIHPTQPPVFTLSNLRTAAPEPVGGNIVVASFNVLNYFTTFTNGQTASGQTGQGCSRGGTVAASNCRGASSLAKFVRQRAKIVETMAAQNADVLGLMEIQNNGLVAVQKLVDALNAKVGAGTHVTPPLPAQGTGSDAIRVAGIYKLSRLTLLGAPVSDTDPVNNRPTLAQSFVLSDGERFSLLVNHIKSKGSCPAAGDVDAAGRLDHAMASPPLSARVSCAAHGHINADETALADYNLEFKAPLLCNGATPRSPDPYSVSPYRSPDHDPVVVGPNMNKIFYGASARGVLVGSAGDDLLIGGPGANTMTGGAGSNVFVDQSMRDAGDGITDFVPGKDRIELCALLTSIGANAASAAANGVVKLVAAGANTLLQINVDGSAGLASARTLATLLNVSPAQISPRGDLGLQ